MKKIIILFVVILFIGCGSNFSHKTQNEEDRKIDSLVQEYIRKDSLYFFESMGEAENQHDIWQDSFMVEYRQKIHGYKVKAILKPEASDWVVLAADIYFSKNGKTFMLHSSCFGDTVFCKGRLASNEENLKILDKCKQKTVKADYVINPEEGMPMLQNAPFFFQDMDFDNIPELVVVHQSMAGRFHNEYDIYRLVEGKPILIDYPPYLGITDYPEFDYKKKTISCPIPEGEVYRTSMEVYGISKRRKDVVIMNNRKHYFNKLVKIKTIKYE